MNEMPVFIKVENYKDMVDLINLIKAKLVDAKATLGKIKQLKAQEDSELGQWESNIEDTERKLEFIDKSLFEPEQV